MRKFAPPSFYNGEMRCFFITMTLRCLVKLTICHRVFSNHCIDLTTVFRCPSSLTYPPHPPIYQIARLLGHLSLS